MSRREIEPDGLSALEYYIKHNSLELTGADSAPMRINSNLYMIISRVFNYQKQIDNISIIRLNSYILNMGVKVFDERINPKSFDRLLSKVDEYADGCALGEFNTKCSSERMHKPGFIFDQAFTRNWNQNGGTVLTNYYKSELLGSRFANIATFGFKGRNAGKLTREFLLLLGLRQSELLSETSRAYDNIVKITDSTLEIFEQMVTQL